MNKIEKIQIPNIKDTSLLVVLDSIELEKTLGGSSTVVKS